MNTNKNVQSQANHSDIQREFNIIKNNIIWRLIKIIEMNQYQIMDQFVEILLYYL